MFVNKPFLEPFGLRMEMLGVLQKGKPHKLILLKLRLPRYKSYWQFFWTEIGRERGLSLKLTGVALSLQFWWIPRASRYRTFENTVDATCKSLYFNVCALNLPIYQTLFQIKGWSQPQSGCVISECLLFFVVRLQGERSGMSVATAEFWNRVALTCTFGKFQVAQPGAECYHLHHLPEPQQSRRRRQQWHHQSCDLNRP